MAKDTKAPAAWAVALAARVAAGASISTTSTRTTRKARTTKKTTKATTPVRTKARKVVLAPSRLASALYTSSFLPRTDPVWVACEVRLRGLVSDVANDTSVLAAVLGIDRRSAQRLRAAFGIERRLGTDGVWR